MRTVRHAVVSALSLAVFAVAWLIRGGPTAAPSTAGLLLEALGCVLLTAGSFLGGSLVLKDLVGPHTGSK